MYNLSHLPVRCCEPATLFAIWQKLAEMHRTRFVQAEAESSLAQRPGKTREQMGGRGLVIPNVSAVSKTAAKFVVHAFEAVELTIRGAETRGRRKCRQICRCCFLNGCRQGIIPERIRK